MFGRRKYQNPLTELLDSQDSLSVREFLSHDRLPETSRNDAESLCTYVNKPVSGDSDVKILVTLLEWALTKEHNGPDDDEMKIFQLNRNAANLFSMPGTKFKHEIYEKDENMTIFRMLRKFTMDDHFPNTDPIFAGHFVRIFENSMTFSDRAWLGDEMKGKRFDDGFTMRGMVKFMMENMDIIAYRQCLVVLIERLMESSTGCDDDRYDGQVSLAKDILMYSAAVVMMNRMDDFPEDSRKRKKIDELLEMVEKAGLTPTGQKPNSYAYRMLMGLREGLVDATLAWSVMQSEDLLRWVFACGVFAGDSPLVACVAFWFVESMIYGDAGCDEVGEIDQLAYPEQWDELKLQELIDEFATMIEFSDDEPSEVMIAAFPIFWNYRYNTEDGDKEVKVNRQEFWSPTCNKYTTGSFTYKTLPGKTPMEKYAKSIYTSSCDALNLRIMKALQWYAAVANKKRNSWSEKYPAEKDDVVEKDAEEWLQYQKDVQKMDAVYLQILTNMFEEPGSFEKFIANFPKSPISEEVRTSKDRQSLGYYQFDFVALHAEADFFMIEKRFTWMHDENPMAKIPASDVLAVLEWNSLKNDWMYAVSCDEIPATGPVERPASQKPEKSDGTSSSHLFTSSPGSRSEYL